LFCLKEEGSIYPKIKGKRRGKYLKKNKKIRLLTKETQITLK